MNDENIFTYSLSEDGKIESVKAETIELPSAKTDLVPDRVYCYRLASE